jgi:succinate dehydrogenase / fumarate reductase cytochrome b subunit
VNKIRPVNLDLTTIRFPITAIVSILHRMSGVLVFLFIPVLLWMLSKSTFSEEGFLSLQDCFSNPISKFIAWVVVSGLLYHFVAGVRHLVMDVGFGEEKQSGKLGAKIVLIVSAVLAIAVGVWIW